MRKKVENLCDRAYSFGVKGIQICALFMLTLLGAGSVFVTAYFLESESGMMEHLVYIRENPVIKLAGIFLIAALFLAAACLLKRWHICGRRLMRYVSICTFLSALSWILLTKCILGIATDTNHLSNGAIYSIVEASGPPPVGNYFTLYPFQLGMVFFEELIYRFAGLDNYQFLQILNVVFVCLAQWALYLIYEKMSPSAADDSLFPLLLAGFLPMMFFTIFVYGFLLALALSLWSLYFILSFIEKGSWVRALISLVCLSAAIAVKPNSLIFAAAIMILLLLSLLHKRKPLLALVLILVPLTMNLCMSAVQNYYEQRFDAEFGSGVPRLAHINMGLEEGPRAPGWFNGSVMRSYTDSNYDSQAATEIEKEKLKTRVDYLVRHPMYTIEFFAQKTASQWMEPGFGTLWLAAVRIENRDALAGWVERIVFSDAESVDGVLVYMKWFSSMVYLAALVGMLVKLKSGKLHLNALVLVTLGGFLYHTISEAKGYYVLPYFFLLLPYAAAGLQFTVEKLTASLKDREIPVVRRKRRRLH